MQGRPSRAADGLFERVGAVAGVVQRRRLAAAARPVLDAVAAAADLRREPLAVRSSAVGRTSSVTFVVRSGTDDLVVKLARDAAPAASLDRTAAAQRLLREDPRLAALRPVIPEVVAAGRASGWTWLVERALSGRPAASGRLDPAELARVATVIGRLHAATARPVDPARATEAWLTVRLGVVERLVAAAAGPGAPRVGASVAGSLGAIRDELAADLQAPLSAGWIHGDLWAANVLFDGPEVTGIVDWDSALDGELPEQDLLHLVLFARRARVGGSLGAALRTVLGEGWSPDELALLERAASTAGLAPRPALLLYWLRFVEANLTRVPALVGDRRWVEQNVLQVLA